ncbi:hypothetical protein [Hoeflea poritis]|uniref:Uncharacterized protein n=1 Tax=Hoeflea poritis TaxID=2993659 RepID=A0ABT4VMK6_9HYPH|nr:hypothetical protein [Hoeflea poritis]MDA4845945.1 hypothetical protein [Hoeflea poritis]
MALLQGDAAKGIIPVNYPCAAGEVVAQRFDYAALADLAANDIIELGHIPPNAKLVECVLICDDLDSNVTPTLVFDVGIMSGDWQDNDAARTCGNEIFAASDLGQAGGVARPTLRGAYRIAAAEKARSIGLKVTTAAATAQAGTITLITKVIG